jgi:hypothetical protein
MIHSIYILLAIAVVVAADPALFPGESIFVHTTLFYFLIKSGPPIGQESKTPAYLSVPNYEKCLKSQQKPTDGFSTWFS